MMKEVEVRITNFNELAEVLNEAAEFIFTAIQEHPQYSVDNYAKGVYQGLNHQGEKLVKALRRALP